MITAKTATLLRLLTILATKGEALAAAAPAPEAATVTAVERASGSTTIDVAARPARLYDCIIRRVDCCCCCVWSRPAMPLLGEGITKAVAQWQATRAAAVRNAKVRMMASCVSWVWMD